MFKPCRCGLLVAAFAPISPVAAQTQTQITQSAAARYASADAALNAQWKQTYASMKGLDAKDTSRGGGFGYAGTLLESQRAWLRFREMECSIESGRYAGGSIQPTVVAQCKERMTVARTAQLRTLVWH